MPSFVSFVIWEELCIVQFMNGLGRDNHDIGIRTVVGIVELYVKHRKEVVFVFNLWPDNIIK